MRLLQGLVDRCFGRRGAADPASRHALVGTPELWELKRRFQIEFLEREGLRPQHQLLDIGCGTLRGGIPLIAYLEKGHYTGVDVREEALAEGRKELRGAGLCEKEPRLLAVNDLGSLALAQKFDVVWAFSVFFHMDDAILESCMAFVARHLTDTGALYANVNLGSQPAGSWREFPCLWRESRAYRELGERHGLRVVDLGVLGELGHDSGRPAHDNQHMLRFARA
ncbi:MAG: class I SAM-dependent methyltransferase, partial [Myxococcales bacterium]|nr:class I SAM-dependent methyltransferase [Myxococcales bacterium]